MKGLTLVLCVLIASPSTLLAQAGPPLNIQRAVAGLAVESLQATPAAKPPRANDELYWGGVVMAGLGGALFGSGLGIGSKTVTYDFARLMQGATEVSTSKFSDAIIANM